MGILKEGYTKAKERVHRVVDDAKLRQDKRKAIQLFTRFLDKYDVPYSSQDIEVSENNLKNQPDKTICRMTVPAATPEGDIWIAFSGPVRKESSFHKTQAVNTVVRAVAGNMDETAEFRIEKNEEGEEKYFLWVHHGTSGARFDILPDGKISRPLSDVFPNLYADVPESARVDIENTIRAFITTSVHPEDVTSLVPIQWVQVGEASAV